jgi:hypothetical protein
LWTKPQVDPSKQKRKNTQFLTQCKNGNAGFSHPWSIHDDAFWSIAQAVYATADVGPEPFLTIIPRK